MARQVTGQELIDRARIRANIRGGSPNNATVLAEINGALRTQYRLLLDKDASHARVSTQVVGLTGDESLGLGATNNLEEVLGLWRATTGSFIDLRPVVWTSEERWRNEIGDEIGTTEPIARPGIFWLRGDEIIVRPIPLIDEVLRLTFTAIAPEFLDETTQISFQTDRDEYLIERAASVISQDAAWTQMLTRRADQLEADLRNRPNQRVRQSRQLWGSRRSPTSGGGLA